MNYLKLATVVNSHGLKGEIKVLCNYYGKNFSWQVNKTVYLHNDNEYLPLIINSVRKHKQFLLLTFTNYDKIELVSLWKNKDLVIINNESFSWVYNDMIDYQAFDASSNLHLGQVINFVDNNHQGLWEIKMIDRNTFFIPNNKVFINKVDKIAKKVYFNMIEGLINYD